MTNTMMTKIDKRTKTVVCIEDNKLFYSMAEAENYYGLSRSSVYNVLSGRCKSAGGKHFRYATEEEIPTVKKNITVQTEEIIAGVGKRTNGNCNAVLCIDTGEIYSSCSDAAEAHGASAGNMSKACRTKGSRVAGKRFCYIKDINTYIDSISSAINKANAYDLIIAKENARKELIANVDKCKDVLYTLELKMCEATKALAEAEAKLANFN